MDKKENKMAVKEYKQTTPFTCVASSYLMCLNYLLPQAFVLNRDVEMGLHDKIKFWEGGDGEYGSYPKLARHSLNLGLNVKMVLNGPKKPDFMPAELWKKYMDNFLPIIDSIKENPQFNLEKRNFTSRDLIDEINSDRVAITEIKYPDDSCTHHIVVYGFDENKIYIIDPISGPQTYSKDRLSDAVNIGYMKNFISLSKPKGLEVKLISEGLPASGGDAIGKCRVIGGYDPDFEEGIIVAPRTDPEMTPNMISASGIITDQGGILCHAAIVAREIGVPCIVGAGNATSSLKNGDKVYLDGDSGRAYKLEYDINL